MPVAPPIPYEVGLPLAEQAALKAKVSGLTVPNTKAGATPVTVPVRYRHPEGERNPQGQPVDPSGVQYPLITIDGPMSITYDRKRDHVNNVDITYVPDLTPAADVTDGPYLTEYPLPVRLLFQVTSWAVSARHSMTILSQMLQPDVLPMRHAWLYVPTDDTIRWIDTMATRQDDMIDGQKRRIFRNVFTVYVEAEMLKTTLAAFNEVTEVILDPPEHQPGSMSGVY
jgi:hypothetical protein